MSTWLSAEEAVEIAALPFVRELRPVARTHRLDQVPAPLVPDVSTVCTHPVYGCSEAQLALVNAMAPLERGIDGTGVRVGFIDTEFGTFWHPAFDAMVRDRRVLAIKNFVGEPQLNFHGMNVASVALGYAEGELVGPAHGAEALFAITEDVRSETNQEEDNMVAALEWMERQGADVVNISLGYATFEAGQHSYTQADLDGDTGLTTRAADLAAQLGVVVVAAAGNGGWCATPDQCWYYVTMPADGDSVIAVGATDPDGYRAEFSARGPTADGRIKPDVMAPGKDLRMAVSSGGYSNGGIGTSFASPLVTGVVAQILQVHPGLSPMQVRALLRTTASQSKAAKEPTNRVGWGLIDADAAVRRAEQQYLIATGVEEASSPEQALVLAAPYPNPARGQVTFELTVPFRGEQVALSVYDVLGRRVAVPFTGFLVPGIHRIDFDARDLSPGVYVYRLRGDGVAQSGTLVRAR